VVFAVEQQDMMWVFFFPELISQLIHL